MPHISELLKLPDEAQRYLWGDLLIVGGLSIIAGPPKRGKSTLIRNLVANVARNATGIPRLATEAAQDASDGATAPLIASDAPAGFLGASLLKGPVLHITLEDDASYLARAFRELGVTANDPLYVEIGPKAFRNDAVAIEWLASKIDETKAILCVIDPLFKFVKMRSISNYAAVNQAIEPLLRLARDTGCHILTAHHTTKGKTKDPMNSILGSTAIFGAVDTAMLIDEVDESDPKLADYRRIWVKQKYGRGFAHRPTRFNARDWAHETVYRRVDGGERIVEGYREYWEAWITGLESQGIKGAREWVN